MFKKLFIIAGNKTEFHNWCLHAVTKDRYTETNFIYVWSVDTLRGHSNFDGLCIGTWKDRQDIYSLMHILLISATDIKKQENIHHMMKVLRDYRNDNES